MQPFGFSCPESLSVQGYELEQEQPRHKLFLRRLFFEHRSQMARRLYPRHKDRQLFLEQQFALQYQHYHFAYEKIDHLILTGKGGPVGVVYLAEELGKDGPYQSLVNFHIASAHQHKGIGTALLRSILAAAQIKGMPVRLTVETSSPAHRLYRYLGFRALEGGDGRLTMEWVPERNAL